MVETEHNPYVLAGLAECVSPDSLESPGALFLVRIADDVAEHIAADGTEGDRYDVAHEIADIAVPVYTYDLWRTFVDLGAYQEDPTELGATGADMDQAARVCLYMIAERLAAALLDAAAGDDEGEGE